MAEPGKLTKEQLQEILEIAKAATPGPWINSFDAEQGTYKQNANGAIPWRAKIATIISWSPTFIEAANPQIVQALIKELLEARQFIQDVAHNWDCDSDAHRYDTSCRVCWAERLEQGVPHNYGRLND